MRRYWIERVFQEAKQPLGLPQHPTRCWPAWQHHVALTTMARHLLLQAQLDGHDAGPSLCFARLQLLAQKRQNLLLQDETLRAAIHKRAAYITRQPPPKGPT